MTIPQPKGATWVFTPQGEALSVEQTVGHLVLSNGSRVQVKRMFGTGTTNTTTELLAADASKLFRLLSLTIVAGGVAPTVTLKSASTAITPAFALAANQSYVWPFCVYGWAQTNAINEALNVTVSNSADVQIIAHFIELTTDLFDLL